MRTFFLQIKTLLTLEENVRKFPQQKFKENKKMLFCSVKTSDLFYLSVTVHFNLDVLCSISLSSLDQIMPTLP